MLFTPIEDQLLALELLQKRSRHPLDLVLLGVVQLGSRAHEEVVDRKLLLVQVFGEPAPLLFVQSLRELDQLLEEGLHVEAASVVVVNQLLEAFDPVGAGGVQLGQGEHFGGYSCPQPLDLHVFLARGEVLRESVPVNLVEVDHMALAVRRLMDDVGVGRDGFVEQSLHLPQNLRDVYRWAQRRNLAREEHERRPPTAELVGGGVRQDRLEQSVDQTRMCEERRLDLLTRQQPIHSRVACLD